MRYVVGIRIQEGDILFIRRVRRGYVTRDPLNAYHFTDRVNAERVALKEDGKIYTISEAVAIFMNGNRPIYKELQEETAMTDTTTYESSHATTAPFEAPSDDASRVGEVASP